MTKTAIYTNKAPEPIGPYSQATRVGNLVFISGQIPIDPVSNQLDLETIQAQAKRVFKNLQAICEQVDCSIDDIVKLNLYFTDLSDFNIVNEVMQEFFTEPYPARAAVQVSALPKNVNFEAEATLVINTN